MAFSSEDVATLYAMDLYGVEAATRHVCRLATLGLLHGGHANGLSVGRLPITPQRTWKCVWDAPIPASASPQPDFKILAMRLERADRRSRNRAARQWTKRNMQSARLVASYEAMWAQDLIAEATK